MRWEGKLFHSGGAGCPYISRKMLLKGQNDRTHDFPSGGMPLGFGGSTPLPPHLHPSCVDPLSRNSVNKKDPGTSLVVQSIRIHLPMQGPPLRSLIQEDPTCCRATNPESHDRGASALESGAATREAATTVRSPGNHSCRVAPAHGN